MIGDIFRRKIADTALAAFLIAAACFVSPACAQVVVIVNGAPITALDIEQRMKLEQITSGKATPRQEVINLLVDDRLKLAVAKRYSFEIGDNEVDEAFGTMARRVRMTTDQLVQMLASRGASAGAFKAKLRADITWQQLVRGRFQSSLQVGDSDIDKALKERGATSSEDAAFVYTLYPIIVVLPSGSPEAALDAKRREAENLRGRFQNCADGLKLARALRDVAVREPISRSSADLPQQLRELLGKMELGQLTTPETTAQGLQMFALCDKKEAGKSETAAKKETRDEIFAKRFQAEGDKWLRELRTQAMIEYR